MKQIHTIEYDLIRPTILNKGVLEAFVSKFWRETFKIFPLY